MKPPVAAGRGSGGLSYDIVPGKPEESILVFRTGSIDPGIMMPELGKRLIHEEGLALLREWVAAMPAHDKLPRPGAGATEIIAARWPRGGVPPRGVSAAGSARGSGTPAGRPRPFRLHRHSLVAMLTTWSPVLNISKA